MSVSYHNKVVSEDMDSLYMLMDYSDLKNKTILVTGANGMLACYVTFFLCYLNKEHDYNVKVIALCRNRDKAMNLFGEFLQYPWFELLIQDICDSINVEYDLDYVFHLAGSASPYYIKHDPVGIIKSNIIGTINLLDSIKNMKNVKVLYSSSREVYGSKEEKQDLKEDDFGWSDPMENRACYPESKRATETILKSYSLQYRLNFNTVRIAHAYGPGMNLKNDGRVMSDLMGNIVDGENIVLKSEGKAERAFCYITDAIYAMFLILLYGKNGEAYNISNETQPVTILDLSCKLSKIGAVEVIFDIPDECPDTYCQYKRSSLNTYKLKALGWSPHVFLDEGLIRTYNSFK